MLLIIIVVKTLLFRSHQIKNEKAEIPDFGNECVIHLSQAVKFKTVSYATDSPVDTSAFSGYIDFIQKSYPLVASKLTREVFNKFSLLYTWKGK